MGLTKKKDKNLLGCPFRNMKTCAGSDCMLFREGYYVDTIKNENVPFKDCAFNIMTNNVEALHTRMFGLQKEFGETKNVLAIKILSEVAQMSKQEVARQTLKILGLKPVVENTQTTKVIDVEEVENDI